MFNSNFLRKMTKSRFNLRNVVKIGVTCLVVCMMFSGCKDPNDDPNNPDKPGGNGKLSPPSWIQGSWTDEDGVFTMWRFTTDAVYMGGHSLEFIWSQSAGGASTTIKETKKTDALYEITVTADDGEGDKETSIYSFKKGDGTYIETALFGEGETPDYEKYYKKN